MTITLDSTSSGIQTYGVSTLTISHTASGPSSTLVVAAGTGSSADVITSVTYNGVALTRVSTQLSGASASSYIYVLSGIAAGTANIVLTMSNSTSEVIAQNATFNGVNVSTPVYGTVNGSNNGFQNSPLSNTVTVPTGGLGYDVIVGSGTDPVILGSGQTQILQSSHNIEMGTSTLPAATSMGWSWTGGQRQATHMAMALNPISSGPTPPVLSSPTASATGSSTATGTVSTTVATGTLYSYISTNATETIATIKAANHTQTVTALGTQNVSFSGLTASTAYYAHYVHTDTSSNDSNEVDSSQITTTSASTYSFLSDVITNNTGVLTSPGTTFYWNWYPGGRIGSLSGITPSQGTAVLNANSRLPVTGLPTSGAGILFSSIHVTGPSDDSVYYESGTAS